MKTTRSLTLFFALALLGLVFLALSAPTARAADPVILRVTTSGSTFWPCGQTDWSTPCTLDTALTNAFSGYELWVAAGTYTPTVGVTRTVTFQLLDGVALYGGFAMTETLSTQRNFTANVTILSGDIGVPGDASDNAFHVVTGSGVTNTAILDGFTVTGGKADGDYPYNSGGGMYNDVGSPTVTNVTFSGNAATGFGGGMDNDFLGNPTLTNVTFSGNSANEGGGMYNFSSNPTLTNVTFSGNTSGWGGGMFNEHSSPTLTNTTFSDNAANLNGGGMENYNHSSPTLTNVTFVTNSATFGGGGMYNDIHSSPTLTNVTFSGNTAVNGGGMDNEDNSSPTLTNVTFSGNTVSQYGGGMYTWTSSPTLTNVTFSGNSASIIGGGMDNEYSGPTVHNAILWGNAAPSGSQIYDTGGTPSFFDSVVQGGYAGGTHIVTDDPRLGALGNYGGSTQTVPLLPGSSAIDAGNSTTCVPIPTDQRGKLRVGICDIGAFEAQGFTLTKAGGDNQSTLVNTTFATALRVNVGNLSGDPVNGGVVTFAAPLSGASATPVTSTVTIVSGAVTQTLTANGTFGSYVVTANTAGATALATFSLINTKTDTTTMLTSSANPSVRGQSVTLTAAVSGASPSGAVSFQDGGADVPGCAAVPLSGGSAACLMSALAVGTHNITAAYGGDANNNASSSLLAQVVNKSTTTTVVTSSPNPVSAGHPITFTVTVSAVPPASVMPTGTVELSETAGQGAAIRGTRRALVSQPLVNGVATFSLSSLTPGAHTFLATYSGDANCNASTSAIYTQNVGLVYDYLPLIRR